MVLRVFVGLAALLLIVVPAAAQEAFTPRKLQPQSGGRPQEVLDRELLQLAKKERPDVPNGVHDPNAYKLAERLIEEGAFISDEALEGALVSRPHVDYKLFATLLANSGVKPAALLQKLRCPVLGMAITVQKRSRGDVAALWHTGQMVRLFADNGVVKRCSKEIAQRLFRAHNERSVPSESAPALLSAGLEPAAALEAYASEAPDLQTGTSRPDYAAIARDVDARLAALTAIFAAGARADDKKLERLISKAAEVNITRHRGGSEAYRKFTGQSIAAFVKSGAKPNEWALSRIEELRRAAKELGERESVEYRAEAGNILAAIALIEQSFKSGGQDVKVAAQKVYANNQMTEAIDRGDERRVLFFLSRGEVPDQDTLIRAAQRGMLDASKGMIEKGVASDLNRVLLVAIRGKIPDLVIWADGKGIVKGPGLEPVIVAAAQAKRADIVAALFKRGADPAAAFKAAMKSDDRSALELVAKAGGAKSAGMLAAHDQKQAEARRQSEAKSRAAEAEASKRRQEQNDKVRAAHLAEKNVGDLVCQDGKVLLGLIGVTINAYVEGKNGSNVQLRINDTGGQSIQYGGGELRVGKIIWDSHTNWRRC